uniref:Orf 06169 protein n=1 Tax=Saccharomyces cerevisiae TaxID=4932 RepID=E9PA94_YEASX|nr:orf 06169 [Saccharomyces cerevisiae]
MLYSSGIFLFYRSKITHNILGRNRFSSTRFTTYHNGLILFVIFHQPIRFFGNGKQVRFQFTSALSRICLDHVLCIKLVDTIKRVCSNQNNTRVCVDIQLRIALFDGM